MKKHHEENESIFVQLNYSDALNSKKELLEMTASIINMQMIAEKMKKYGKEETSERNNAKKQIKTMISEINSLAEKMPKVKIEKREAKEKKEKAQIPLPPPAKAQKAAKELPQKAARKTLNEELLEIKKKIESLKA